MSRTHRIQQTHYSPGEELANQLTHGFGLAASVIVAPLLVGLAVRSGDPWSLASVSVYVASLVFLYLASTLYHTARDPDRKRLLRQIDHSAIFVLIAGSYTPISIIVLRGGLGWTLTGIIWALAAAGIAWKIRDLDRYRILGPAFYIGMGWLAVLAFPYLLEALTGAELAWLVAGGLAYTSGIVFYAWKRLPFNHAIWHLFVLAGSACHVVVLALRLSSVVA